MPKDVSFNIVPTAFIVLIMGLLFISCKNRSIDPFEEEEGVFSVYGALKVDEPLNYIRVRNLLQP
ncbi:MAG: hypothetical protein R3220_09270, partial [Balneolaceae bacterium]|nr:hypothetical protein [Balneolaceae bacterium]